MTGLEKRATGGCKRLLHSPLTPLLVIVLGLAERTFLLWKYPDLWFCSDEANLGLMAIRLIRDGTANVFIAGESYGGFLAVAVISLFTLFAGPFVGIKLAALLFFVLFAMTLYLLACRLFDRQVGLMALLLVCLAPSFLANVGVRQRGPHGETLLLGCALLLVTVVLSNREQVSLLCWLGWGFLTGFAWYTYYLSLVFIVPAVIFTAIQLARSRDFRYLSRSTVAILMGVLTGSGLYWFFVLRHGILPPFQSMYGHVNPLAGLYNFFLVGLPVITGSRWAFHRQDLVPLLSKLALYFYLAAVVLWTVALVRKESWLKGPHLLIGLHLTLYPIIFSFSSFSWFADEPRYLIGLYATLPIVAAWLVSRIQIASTTLALATLTVLATVSVGGTLTMPSPVFNTIFDEPTEPLIEYLREEHLDHFYANYWITYRLMFESVQEVSRPFPLVGATYFSIVRPRYPDFEQAVRDHPNPAFIAWNSEAPEFAERLDSTGRSYRRAQIGRCVVFSEIEPALTWEELWD